MYRITSNHHNTHTHIYIYYANTWSFAPEASACSLNVWACQSACRTIRCKPSACGLPPNGTLTHDFQQGAEKKTMELWWIVCSFCLNMCGGEKKPTSGIFRRLSMALSSAASSSQTRLQTSTQHLSPRLRHECRSKMLSPALEVHRTRCQEGPHAWESIKRIKETRSNTKVWEMQWSHVESWYWSMIWKLMESFCIWF